MTILWSFFWPGVLLLLLPADRLLSSQIELLTFERFHSLENSPRYRPWWWVPLLWLDPLRGFFGTYLLLRSLAIGPVGWARVPKPEYALLVGVLVVAMVAQTLTRRGDREGLLAPIGFVAGVVAGLTPWTVGLIAIATALIGLFGFRQFTAFFACGVGAVALLGFAFGADLAGTAAAAAVFAVPAVMPLLMGRTLEMPTRNSTGSGRKPE